MTCEEAVAHFIAVLMRDTLPVGAVKDEVRKARMAMFRDDLDLVHEQFLPMARSFAAELLEGVESMEARTK